LTNDDAPPTDFGEDWLEASRDPDWQELISRSFFAHALAPSAYHWHFQQASDALRQGLYLPGLSGLLNGIEASIRTICCLINAVDLSGDLGRPLCNLLLMEAQAHGLDVEKLALPEENDFIQNIRNSKTPVGIVRLRNNVCHGNFNGYHQFVEEAGVFIFTPECLRQISATLLDVSYEWALEVSRFTSERGWRPETNGLLKPKNPLAEWLDKRQ
jgi:hypothetical protein